ncbi:hypothetical protein BSZ39_03810 [Bowdeniella nasicola]|uniref:CobW C-terminal domain-containing protein n=1 Tax=Bowdeniella nasicola TaxID=208480 RepID=A0A1Q5Q3X4_9ACTO|nr:GTP-binding protein [Bowdeniella nasicola]OKL54507.1 hypothetical protein BSZ39_03810 [Bowdeniella nasicola]
MRSTPLALLATTDPVLRECAAFDLVVSEPGTVALVHTLSEDATAVRRVVIDANGVISDRWHVLDDGCFSCGIAGDAVNALEEIISMMWPHALAYFPPLAIDPLPLSRVVNEACQDGGLSAHLSSVSAVVDTTAAVEDLLEPITLEERRIASDAPERSIGEAILAQISVADLIVAHGGDGPGGELVEHLRAHDTLLTGDLHDGDVHPLLFGGEHSAAAALARVDPRGVQPWGGPSEYGTWTLDLASTRPFHPARLLDNIELLGAGRLVHRGRFWVPTRPGTICSWEGAGGQVSVGVVGSHPVPAEVSTRLVICGNGDERERLQRAFADSLLTDEELTRDPRSWEATSDELEPWLGAVS